MMGKSSSDANASVRNLVLPSGGNPQIMSATDVIPASACYSRNWLVGEGSRNRQNLIDVIYWCSHTASADHIARAVFDGCIKEGDRFAIG